MPDPFLKRAEAIKKTLLAMESEAPDEDLFALGYMIPQIELVQEMAQYEPLEVTAEDFDVTYRQWLETTFMEDGMESDDRQRIDELWQSAISRTS
ncbi:YfcL family protein [Kushneria marisflavi]|uniref:Uncharacterized protein n=1 Tax=Kushneria marisflavi TaxID=157779 RepID=A0A240UTV9_9GAMM|nr:YfcL family protein [Kushneria marisflavi]ART64482.1 hypothetical protein B9H00_16610 [Kushneria marisflavi]RKD86635.1 YfcL protein [Kushneria marisflavi]